MSKEYCEHLKEKMKECYKCPIEMCDAFCMIGIHYKQWKNDCEKYDKKNVIRRKKNSFINDLAAFYDDNPKK
jgi:hypothetical protein